MPVPGSISASREPIPLQGKKEFSLESTAFRGQLKPSTAFWSAELVYQSDHGNATDCGGGASNNRNLSSHCPRGQNFKFKVLAGWSLLRLLLLACR